MPITVKHEADIGGLAGLSALAGALSRGEQPRMPAVGRGGGGGGRQAPVMLPGIPSYEDLPHQLLKQRIGGQLQELQLRDQLSQQAKQREIEREREQQLWVEEFTPQQKHEMTKNRNSRQMVLSGMHSGEVDYPTGVRMLEQLDSEYEAYSPQKRPRNSSDPPEYPQGQGIGQSWVDEDGNRHTREPGGKDVVQVPFEKTKDGIQLKLQVDREKAELERQRKRDDAIQAMRSKLTLERMDVMGELGQKTGTRLMNLEEIKERLRVAYPELSDGPESPTEKGPWWERARKEGIDVYKVDKKLPPNVGYAQAWMRHMLQPPPDGYGSYEGIPIYKRTAFAEASQIVAEYLEQVTQGQ